MQLESTRQTGLGIRWSLVPWDEWTRRRAEVNAALDRLYTAVVENPKQGTLGDSVERRGGIERAGLPVSEENWTR